MDHCLTFHLFVSSFTNCSKCSNTTLISAPGNHCFESDLIVEDIYSFSMLAEPFSSIPQIICSLDTKFEFRNMLVLLLLKELCHHISVFLVKEAGWGSPLSNQVRGQCGFVMS